MVAAALVLGGCSWLDTRSPEADSRSEPASRPEAPAAAATAEQSAASSPASQETATVAPTEVTPPANPPASPPPASVAQSPDLDAEPAPEKRSGADALNAYPDSGPNAVDPIRFRDAVGRASAVLFKQARETIGSEVRPLVIDPLVDGGTGQQTDSTVEMGRILTGLMQRYYPTLVPSSFTRATLAQQPILFIGTLTPYSTSKSQQKPADAFRLWLTLIDLRTGKIVAKVIDKATAVSVDAVPLSYYRDSPTWPRDKTVSAYINSCTFKTKIGDPADPDYLARLPAAAVINEAVDAFSSGDLAGANQLFHEAQEIADKDDLRILNGLYLTSWRLGKTDEARDAFARIVAAGLHTQRLPLKFLFVPTKAELVRSGELGSQYVMWLHEVAAKAWEEGACLQVVGHTSRTGPLNVNEALSYARASSILAELSTDAPAMAARMTAQGVGYRENLIGLGTDDLRDALDRRVELVVTHCGSAAAAAHSPTI